MSPLILAVLFSITKSPDTLTVPITPFVEEVSPQDKWMERLANCESGGSTTIRVWDTNNRWSVGKYQYQYATWLRYSKKFGTTRENITDGKLQDEVTRYVLDNGGQSNWFNCSKLIGDYPKEDTP